MIRFRPENKPGLPQQKMWRRRNERERDNIREKGREKKGMYFKHSQSAHPSFSPQSLHPNPETARQ